MKLEEFESVAAAMGEPPHAEEDAISAAHRKENGEPVTEETRPPKNTMHVLSTILLFFIFLFALPISIAPFFLPDLFANLGIPKEISFHLWTGAEWLLLLLSLGLSFPVWMTGAGDLVQLHSTSRGLYICTLGTLTLLAVLMSIHRFFSAMPTHHLLPTVVIAFYAFVISFGSLREKRIASAASASIPPMHTIRSLAARFIAFSLLLAFAASLCWFVVGHIDITEAIILFFALAALATPAAFPLALPLACSLFQKMAKLHHMEIKTPRLFELLSDVSVVVYDRSGTVTEGRPFLSQIITEGLSESTLIGLAASLENGEDHPLSPIIMNAAIERNARLSRTSARNCFPGLGIEAIISGRPVRLGKRAWLDDEGVTTSASLITQGDQAASKGKICVYLATDKSTKGILVFTDEIRHDTRRAIRLMSNIGVKSLLLTGDCKQTAKRLARDAGIQSVRFDLAPEDKVREIQLLSTRGHTSLMLAAGKSDVKALAAADISVQCKKGMYRTASDDFTPDVVLMSDTTADLPKLVALGKGTRKIFRTSLITAFIVQLFLFLLANFELAATHSLTFYPMYLLIGEVLGIFLCTLQMQRLRYLELPVYAIDR
ncbi:hypothetical protein TAMA11512_14300 [Selenomonas sp. TAMA-11512]|nr:hypothetical protein TAMA11512_14300 [Selenomonas sp. TAMA-11512]